MSYPQYIHSKFELAPVFSLAIPPLTMASLAHREDGNEATRPHGEKSRFHTGTRFTRRRDPARERAASPRWRAQSDSPGMGTRAADRTVAAVRSAVFRTGTQVPATTGGEGDRRQALAGMFIGEYTFKVDSKGRVSIPALFRRELEEGDPEAKATGRPRMVIVYGADTQKMLQVYSYEGFQKLAAEINARPYTDPRRAILQRLVLNKAHPTEIDPDGRLVLPATLRGRLTLEGEAYFAGMGETFEIWKPETFAAVDAVRMEKLLAEMGEDFDPLSLLGGEG
ncbi:Transcriptional regulator MraZ [bioreactor metagenome]|uniref:Transcriptional regulator MraZ n=1 Tax=bioreactor metagenome TaxID=1076179 RepID=A0A644WB52_9ZZZZ